MGKKPTVNNLKMFGCYVFFKSARCYETTQDDKAVKEKLFG